MAVQASVERDKAYVSGLWSVKMVKLLPSKMNRKCRIPAKQDHNTRSNALHFTWASESFLEKKPNGALSAVCCQLLQDGTHVGSTGIHVES